MANKKRMPQGAGNIRERTVMRKGKEYTFWEGQVTVGYDPGTGKQIRKAVTGQTKAEVLQKMQSIAVDVQKGTFFEPSKITLSAWLEEWINNYCPDLKYLTLKKYRSAIDTHINPALGAVKLAKLDKRRIQSFYNELSKSGKVTKITDEQGRTVERKEPLAPKTIHCIHGVLSKALNEAKSLDMIPRNPAEDCKLPKMERKEVAPLTDEQVKKLLEVCENEDYGGIYKLIVFTGLREGEALGLTWDCVDFDKGVLKINKQLQRRDGKEELVSLKNSKPRYLTVPPFVLQLLREQHVKQLESRFKAKELWQGFQTLEERKTALVFTKADGANITAAALYQRYKRIAKEIGAPESRVHDLRHTYAVLALQNGDSHKTLQDNLGHATAAFTLTVYGHTSERMREESASKMQQFIESVM